MIGRTIGNYSVVSELGRGGMGVVYLAEHPRIGRRVAIKVLLPEYGRDPELLARFFNEARAATAIHNDHIVDVIDFGELDEGGSYIVMECLEGRSLADALDAEPRMEPARVLHIARGIARALAAAHAHHIVHRDLKPDNVFLVRRDDDPDFVKVLDFGIAKLSGAGEWKTQTSSALLGTPYYMSPEQWNGTPVDPRVDVYALGVMIYEMLAGRRPFEGNSLAELCAAHTSREPPLLGKVVAPVDTVIRRALAKDREARFGGTMELVQALEDAAAGRATPAVTPASAPRDVVAPVASVASLAPTSSASAVRTGAIVIALGIVCAALIVGLSLRSRSQPSESAPAAPVVNPMDVVTPTPLPVTAAPTPTKSRARTRSELRQTWQLGANNCPAGALSPVVLVIIDGTRLRVSAAGHDSHGTIDATGRFRVTNAYGTCAGMSDGKVLTETCTSSTPQIVRNPSWVPGAPPTIAVPQSCNATYRILE